MKTALYIEDGVSQVVLTSENDVEKRILRTIKDNKVSATVELGDFGMCNGGYIRHFGVQQRSMYTADEGEVESLMIVLQKPEEDPQQSNIPQGW